MTAKEKADEIYVGFWYLTNDSRIAKQCALICVDEKMNFLESIEHQIDVDNYYFLYKELKYEKEQIEKL